MLADLIEIDEPVIVEGMQGYRLLRKGVELANFYPDVVIELQVTEAQVERVYRAERQAEKLPKLSAFNKMHQTILESYKALKNPHPPEWITVQNQY
jgi:thymidylate kinase